MNAKTEYLSDFELVGMLKKDGKDSELAFTELYRRYSSRIYVYCRKFIGNSDDAKDLFQEAFINFYEKAKNEDSLINVSAFLLKIARNLCLNFKRRDKTEAVYQEYMDFKEDFKDDFQNDHEELLNLITITLDLLPPELKDIFILREYEGLSYTQISEITNLDVSNLKTRLYRAKQKIRELLQPYLEEFAKY